VNGESLGPINIQTLLKKYDIRPSKGLGQNFLVDENALRKVVNAANLSDEDLILEVGPGLGSLTRFLGASAGKVIAVELDEKLLPALHETLAPLDNVEIVMGDILELDPANLLFSVDRGVEKEDQLSPVPKFQTYKVVANIPYYITSALIRHLLEAEIQPSRIVLTVQKEVAQRICEQPPKMSLLALSVQVYGEPKIAAKIPAGSFYPAPKVDSSVVTIEIYPNPLIPHHLLPYFFRLAKAGFNQKRKTLRNAISAGMAWSKDEAESALNSAGIDPQRRAQTLSVHEWETLTISATQQ
jgi:16S rRNA (adenine1518-N6/adenine1519-N6)-dimethyltransferase